MNRLDFIKSTFAAVVGFSFTKEKPKREYTFGEIFHIHKGNDRLIYPKHDSDFYKWIFQSFADKAVEDHTPVYMGVHTLLIPIKDKYTLDDFLPIKFYFEREYNTDVYSMDSGYKTHFRFLKDKEDRMYLDVFTVNSWNRDKYKR